MIAKAKKKKAMKTFPCYFDEREREILRIVAKRDRCSKAAVVRRSIRNLAIEVLEMQLGGTDAAAR